MEGLPRENKGLMDASPETKTKLQSPPRRDALLTFPDPETMLVKSFISAIWRTIFRVDA
jgi:hypothetical protein